MTEKQLNSLFVVVLCLFISTAIAVILVPIINSRLFDGMVLMMIMGALGPIAFQLMNAKPTDPDKKNDQDQKNDPDKNKFI